MRITIPDLPQLARPQRSRPASLAVDTRGLQTLAASTGAVFDKASKAAWGFWELEMQEQENEQLAAAVTSYGNGLNEAASQAVSATPDQHRSVFEAVSGEALQDIRESITNKQAKLRFDLHAAGKYTTQATEQRKLARSRIIESTVFRFRQKAKDLIAIAGDTGVSQRQRTDALLALFGRNVRGLPVTPGLYERGVAAGVIDGTKAAEAARAAELEIITNLAYGFVMKSSDPELTAMGLQQFKITSGSVLETEVRVGLSRLGQAARAEVMKKLNDKATEVAQDRVDRRTRINAEHNVRHTEMYHAAFSPDLALEDVRELQRRLERSWTGLTPEKRQKLADHISKRSSGQAQFATFDRSDSVMAIIGHLLTGTLTDEVLADHQEYITQPTYEKYSGAMLKQNAAGFQRANKLILAEFRYSKYRVADSTDGLVRATQAAAQNAQAEMLRWLEENKTATPAEMFDQAEKIILDERKGFRLQLLTARKKYLRDFAAFTGGLLVTDDPLAELKQRIKDGQVKSTVHTSGVLSKLEEYKEHLGAD